MRECEGMWPVKEFKQHFWQREPVLMRGCLPELSELLDANDLASLACLPEVEARLVWENGPDRPWQVESGPFTEQRLSSLPPKGWTLLVQKVDRMVAEVADQLDRFRFLPNWRIDDVMVSYAVDGAGIGAHVDLYDVFLIQGRGQRDWLLGKKPLDNPDLLPDLDLKILREPGEMECVRLEAGDILYVPPRFAHQGIARGEAMTYSVGFRAPSFRDLIQEYVADRVKEISEADLYVDPDASLLDEGGLLSAQLVSHFESEIQRRLFPGDHFANWLAAHLSKPPTSPAPVDFGRVVAYSYRHLEGARFIYLRGESAIDLYVEGDHWQLELDLEAYVAQLCRQSSWTRQEAKAFCQDKRLEKLWDELMEKAYIYATES